MVLAYAPFGEIEIARPPNHQPTRPIKSPLVPDFTKDATECNWLVLFFIAGVFLMGFTDSIRRP
jgi:hypothetical protein